MDDLSGVDIYRGPQEQLLAAGLNLRLIDGDDRPASPLDCWEVLPQPSVPPPDGLVGDRFEVRDYLARPSQGQAEVVGVNRQRFDGV